MTLACLVMDEMSVPPILPHCLTIYSTAAFTLSTKYGKTWDGTVEYSLNGADWNTWAGTSATPRSRVLYLRGVGNTHFNTGSVNNGVFYFSYAPEIYCKGDLKALLDYQKETSGVAITPGNYAFTGLFCGDTALVEGPGSSIEEGGHYMYASAFKDCTNLKTVGDYTTNNLRGCNYAWMFSGCTSLTSAMTTLPATVATEFSTYEEMFSNCSSLSVAPEEIKLTEIQMNGCYGMFKGCTSLTTPPSLSTSITQVWQAGFKEMFSGCTNLLTVPKLSATSIGYEAYRGMFSGCSELTQINKLPAQNIDSYGYYEMYNRCSKIAVYKLNSGGRRMWKIPYSGSSSSVGDSALTRMLSNTAGEVSYPVKDTTYYTTATVV